MELVTALFGSSAQPRGLLELLDFRTRFDFKKHEYIRVRNFVETGFIRYLQRYPEKMKVMPHRQFEELIAEIMAPMCYKVELTPYSNDGGKDVIVFVDALVAPLYIECKRLTDDKPISVKPVRELYGVKCRDKAAGCIFVTSSYYTKAAQDFVGPISAEYALKDYEKLKRWILKHSCQSPRLDFAELLEY